MIYRRNKKTGKVTELFNLGWLLRNGKAVDEITLIPSDTGEVFLTATTDADATSDFFATFADYQVCLSFVTKGLRFPFATIIDKVKESL